ncbi:MAG: CRISPR-associated protein [Betaproteobacteria bacterium]|nr:CRISPR-associated protein [Betaproteobacteria bacterium]
MARHYTAKNAKSPSRRELLAIAGDASSYHDFGKLDDGFQETLRTNRCSPNHVRHEDAGVVMLAQYGALEAAGLVSAHHRGLPRYIKEQLPPRLGQAVSKKLSLSAFRIFEHPQTVIATDTHLQEYLRRHESTVGSWRGGAEDGLSKCSGFTRRVLLSCLVDADHSDTARHYGQAASEPKIDTRWTERLNALDQYVSGLKPTHPVVGEAARVRQEIREKLYFACRESDTVHPLRSCDAVVGSGKTTAIMAHLLKVADAKKLRHIFVVLPYTNIIRQSVEVYRKALCLEGEVPEEIVAEHHHLAAFKDLDLRYLTTLWRAPIIVTTAVQFFETLAANHTGLLRKLHELPGSAVFLDEAHAVLPAELWPVCWNWLGEWASQWNGHLVLASGSLPEFWKLDEFRVITERRDAATTPTTPVADVRPLAEDLRAKMRDTEHARVRFASKDIPLGEEELMEWIESSPGPRLVIVNTVQSAAVLAKKMQLRDKQAILHLSTALAPIHRGSIIERVKELLCNQREWTLVATSMVEAGLDFSFATGFRQRSSTSSLIQIGGRVNRGADKGDSCFVWDFDFCDTETFPNNPSLKGSRRALGELFERKFISPEQSPDLQHVCLEALRMEFKPGHQAEALLRVMREWEMDYPEVAQLCRVINSDTRMVLIDRGLMAPIREGRKLPRNELIQRSVQMYPYKIRNLGLERVVEASEELFVLPKGWEYDPECFGYMAGWFEQQESRIVGGYFV